MKVLNFFEMFQLQIAILIIGMIFHQPFVIAQSKGPLYIDSFVNIVDYTVNYKDSFSAFILNDTDGSLDIILERMKVASNMVDELSANSLQRASLDLEIDDEVDPITRQIDQHAMYIEGLYEKYRRYLRNYRRLNKATINDFVRVMTTDKKSDAQSNLKNIYLIAMPDKSRDDNGNIFEYVRQQILDGPPEEQCDNYGSIHHRLIEIYNTLITAEARGHVMTVFSLAVLTQQNNESYEQQMNESAGRLVLRAEEYLLALKEGLMSAPRDYRRCDPPEQVRGRTFIELEKTIQMFVLNEQDINRGSCTSTCEEIQETYSFDCDPSDHWCPSRKCDGITYDCVSGGKYMEVCELPQDSVERYKWVKDYNERMYGQNHGCDGQITKPYGWVRFAVYCDMCICTCFEENRGSMASRAINLRPQLSNVAENMIVTGIKFVLADKMIHLQIKQGKLLPSGRVDIISQKWNPVERFRYDPVDTYGGGFYLLKNNNQEEFMKVGKDHTFIYKKQHMIYLDDLYAGSNYVVTGVRFNHADPNNIDDDGWNLSAVQLEIYVTEFDFDSGILNDDFDSSRWITPQDMASISSEYNTERNIIFVKNNENPTKSKINLPASKPNDGIRFNPSNRWTDVGQSTIPFFDAQPVDGPVSVPLSGIGLFFKGPSGFGGYLALKTISFDFTNELKMAIDSETLDKYKSDFSDPLPYDVEEK
ncbi:hypothetical protein PV327_010628 [Microctonus hyperodae]|uniref:Uncharacterized protein n=1 Tax=Microctonus hyperodae TaxID=165561 RepID=A0AA39FSR1_MICHY|nr:hypothetical protein PV327_010628 [Microctonus hyperodae]